jgi:hypothetical protein
MNIQKDKFLSLMEHISAKNLKFFQKIYTEEIWNNIHFHNNNNEDLKITKKDCISSEIVDSKYAVLGFNKVKMSLLNIPSTTDILSYSQISRLTLRISNRVYINFEVRKRHDGEYYKIYINYNHDKNVDPITIQKQINQAMMMLNI